MFKFPTQAAARYMATHTYIYKATYRKMLKEFKSLKSNKKSTHRGIKN